MLPNMLPILMTKPALGRAADCTTGIPFSHHTSAHSFDGIPGFLCV